MMPDRPGDSGLPVAATAAATVATASAATAATTGATADAATTSPATSDPESDPIREFQTPVPAVAILRDASAAASLLHPMRRRILEHLATRPDSASGVARHLRIPRQKVNYHLRELEKRKLVRLVGETRKGNCTERIMEPAAASFTISPRVFGRLAADRRVDDTADSTAQWAASLSRVLRELDPSDEPARVAFVDEEIHLPNAAAREEFLHAVRDLAHHLQRKYAGVEGHEYRMVAGVHPRPDFMTHVG